MRPSADRASFFEEQARWRRKSWRASAVCGLASVVVGAPLAILVTPGVVLVLGLVLKSLPGRETSLPALVELIGSIPASIELALDEGNTWGILHPRALLGLYYLLLPGMAALFAVWLALRARFLGVDTSVFATTLGARPARSTDFEEIQFGNLVEEMAIASGSPALRVLVLDAAAANAAVLGSGEDRATMVVSRGLLERLDREQTQAVVAHLIGSVAQGDLRVLASLNALFQSLGLVLLVLDAVFALSPSAARDVLRTFRFLLRLRADPAEAADIDALLVSRILELRPDGLHGLTEDLQRAEPRSTVGGLVKKIPPFYALLIPFLLLYVVSLLLRWQVWLLRLVFVGPMVMLVWRSRRYRADAISVQLTRNPDALARALQELSIEGDLLSRSRAWEPLFVVGSESGGSSRGAWSEELGGAIGSHPPLRKRLQRIAAMGGIDLSEPNKQRREPTRITLAVLIASPLVLTIVSLFFFIAVLSMAVAVIPAVGLTLIGLEVALALL